jgi:DNA-binding NarL/FixJ family response regulator
MNRMSAIEFFSEEAIAASQGSRPELNSVAVYQDPLAQSLREPICRLATQPTALRNESAPQRHKIFILEEHPAFRKSLTQFLNDTEDLTVCGTAGAVDQALPAIARTKPDLVLADINLLGKSGLQLIKKLRAADRSAKLLVISMLNEAPLAARVLQSGGDGYIMKLEDPVEIIYAIHDVLEGHIYVSEEVMESPQTRGRSRSFPRANASAGASGGFGA